MTAQHVLYIGQLKMASRLQALQVLPVLTFLQVSSSFAFQDALQMFSPSSGQAPLSVFPVLTTALLACVPNYSMPLSPREQGPGEQTCVSCTANPRSLTHADGRLNNS